MRNAVTLIPSRSNTFVGSVLVTSTIRTSKRGRSVPGCSAPSVEPSTWYAPLLASNIRLRKCREIGRDIVPGRAYDGQRLNAQAIASPHQGSKVGGVIGMQMADADHCEIGELRPSLTEADVAAAAAVEQKPGLCTHPQQITCRSALWVDRRATRAKNLHCDRITNAGLRR